MMSKQKYFLSLQQYSHVGVSLVMLMSVNTFSQLSDTVVVPNYNKRINLSVGIGSIEFVNIGAAVRVIDGLYANLTVGGAFVQGNSFFVPPGGRFIKLGASWKISKNKLIPTLSLDAGKVFLVGLQQGVPSQAYIVSFLVGLEARYEDDFNTFIKIGERYSRRELQEDQYYFGFQIGVGWYFYN